MINVEFEHLVSNKIQIIIRDLQGRLVSQQSVHNKDKTLTQIDISKFENGIYNLSIEDNKVISTQRFVVK